MAVIGNIAIGASVNVGSMVKDLRKGEQALGRFESVATKMGSSLKSLAPAFGVVGAAGAALGAVSSVFDVMQSTTNTATSLEKSITGLSKATDLSGTDLGVMKDAIFKLSTELKGVPLDDLIAIATSGAKMGVANDELLGYTEGIAKLSTAVDDIPAEKLADQIGTLNAVFKMGRKGALQMGSALDKIADSGLSSASGILDVTARIAGTANAMHLGAGESMAMAAALLDTGTMSEQAASSINNLLMNMVAVGNHADFAKTAGVSVKEFGDLVADKPMKAVQAFLGGLQKLSAAGQLEALEKVGITAQERQASLQKMAQQTEKLGEYTAIAASEFVSLNQIQASYNATAETTDAQWTSFYNHVDVLSEQLGKSLLPAINTTLEALGTGLEAANGFAKSLNATLASIPKNLDLVTAAMALVAGTAANYAAASSLPAVEPPKPAVSPKSAVKAAAVAAKARNDAIESVDGAPIPKAIASAQAKAATKAAKDAADAQKRILDEGKAVFDATRTPLEKYTADVEHLNKLLAAGAINQDTYGRAMKAAAEEGSGALGLNESPLAKPEVRFSSAMELGSTEAISAINQFRAGTSGDNSMKEVAKESKLQTKFLEEVAKNTRNAKGGPGPSQFDIVQF